jgi:hypothetical protein
MAGEETRRPVVSRFVLEYLGLEPGAVNDVMLVCVRFSFRTESLFNAIHTVQSLFTAPIRYMINTSNNSQLLVRCSNPVDTYLLGSDRIMFKHDDKLIICIKVQTLSLMPPSEDSFFYGNVQQFLAVHEGMDILNYPRGFGTPPEDVELHQNPTLSATTMWILGVEEGPADCLLRVELKYFAGPKDFVYALRVANLPDVKWAVDEEGSLYLKFSSRYAFDYTSINHFFICARLMLKFYKVATVRKRHPAFDGSFKSIYSRQNINDTWAVVESA